MTTQNQLRKTVRQYQMEERRKQVAVLVTQGFIEVEIARKLGVDNTTISKDIKALKLISKQFIYDITKSDFTFYYKQSLETVKLVLRKQWEIAEKEHITRQDMDRAKILSDILNTVATIDEYYGTAPRLHKSPMQIAVESGEFGIRPGTKGHTVTDEEFKAWQEEEAAELKVQEEAAATAARRTTMTKID